MIEEPPHPATQSDDVIGYLTDADLELEVIGQCAWRGAFALYWALGLRPEHFRRAEHSKIYELCYEIDAEGATPDAMLLRARGGDVMTLNSSDKWALKPNEPAAKLHVQRLAELARGRTVFYEAQRLGKRLVSGTKTDETVKAYLEGLEAALNEDMTGELMLDAHEQYRAWLESVAEREDGRRVWLGVEGLDTVLDGLSAGEVLGVMARPGIGKTLLLGKYIQSVMKHNVPCVMFSLEMPVAQIVTRLIQPEYEMSRAHAMHPGTPKLVTEDGYTQMFQNLWVCDKPALAVSDMLSLTRRVKQKHDVGLVLIDHMGLIGGNRKMSTYDRVAVQAKEIKELAKRCNVAVVLALQVSRNEGGDGAQPLSLAAARDAGVVEEVMDYLIGMYRPERSKTITPDAKAEWKNIVKIDVVKNRHGSVGHELAVRIGEDLQWESVPLSSLNELANVEDAVTVKKKKY